MSWPRVRSRFLFDIRDIRGTDAPLASATMYGVELREDSVNSVWNPGSDVSTYKLVEPGDFVIGLRSFQHGLSHSTITGLVSPAYTVLRAGTEVLPEFYKYYFRSAELISHLSNFTQGIRQGQAIDIEAFSDLPLPLPPISEQARIARYLDQETTQIDELTHAYRAVLEKTTERSQLLIDSLVDSESGMAPLKYFVSFREGPGIMAADFRDSGIPLIRVSGLKGGAVTLQGANFLEPRSVAARWARFRLRLGDYLISGSATMGAVSLVSNQEVAGAIPYTGLIILRPRNSPVSMEYVAVALTSRRFFAQIDTLKAGATMQHFGPTHLAQVSLPFPTLERQRILVSEAREVRDQEGRLANSVRRQVALLAERRQALITAAVTGQIDVSTARGSEV